MTVIHNLRPVYSGHELLRFGPKSDGGYLIPDDLEGVSACFSPGVGKVTAFERDCYDRGLKIFMADNSVDDPSDDHYQFNFTKLHIGSSAGEHSLTMDEWIEKSDLPESGDLLLQMDIEGSEYDVINSMSNNLLQRFRIIAIECHFMNQLWSKRRFPVLKSFFEKILKSHQCIHIHPNNCRGVFSNHGIDIPVIAEFTFLRRDRFVDQKFVTSFPHPLDMPNTDRPEVLLPESWYNNRVSSNKSLKISMGQHLL